METEQAVQRFLQYSRAKNLSPQTIKWYSWALNTFAKQFSQLPHTPEEIESFLLSCHGGDETRHSYYRVIRCLYNFLAKRNGSMNNPVTTVSPPRRSHKLPQVLTSNELDQLLSYPHPPQIKALLTFLADTGARIGEAARLKPEDLKESQWGYVVAIQGKTGQRFVPISAQTYYLLKENLPFHYMVDTLSHKVTQAFKDAGVKGTAHTLRHTFATLWTGSEFALQQILGHSSFQTLKIYRQMRMEYLCLQHAQFSPVHISHQTKLEGF